MKIFFLTIILLGLMSLSAFSQWGAKVGADFGTLAGFDDANYKTGFHAGATYDFKLIEQFYIQPAALFSLHRFGFDENLLVKEGTVNKYSLEIPVYVSFRPSITSSTKLVLDLGLYAKYGLFGNTNYKMQDGESIDKSSYDTYNRFDIGFNTGIGLEIARCYIGGGYQYGLTNGEKGIPSIQNQIFRASLGYKF
jgi:hypothetical protein